MPATTFLADRMQDLLNAAQTALDVARTGNRNPGRIIRTHGPPAVDICSDDLLCVYLAMPGLRLVEVSIGNAQNRMPKKLLPIADMNVELWRCTGSLDPVPAPNVLDGFAAGLANDIWALFTGLQADIDANTLFPGGNFPGTKAMIQDPNPLPPQGAMSGWRIKVSVPLNDKGP
jgi:hypothetical protein